MLHVDVLLHTWRERDARLAWVCHPGGQLDAPCGAHAAAVLRGVPPEAGGGEPEAGANRETRV
eukprot:4417853-Pyramimonas_sp.AAC.1